MTAREVGELIDINTPFEVRDVDSDEVLFQSWEDEDDIPDYELCECGGIECHYKEKMLILWVDKEA